MSEYDIETVLTFHKSKYFWKFLNRQMVITDVDTLNDSDYHLLLFSAMPENFQECINENTGCIDLNSTGLEQITEGFTDTGFSVDIQWIDDGENGFSIYVAEDTEIPINEGVSFFVKGVAVVKQGTETGDNNYCIAFARPSTRLKCQNAISLMEGSEFVGHSSCKEI